MTLSDFYKEWQSSDRCIIVYTSGSTGTPKPLMVEKRRMLESAKITCDFLGLREGDTALLCMPLDYIAGKMMVVRAIERNLNLVSVTPCGRPLAGIEESPVFAAMVPMQVYNSMHNEHDYKILSGIRNLIIGGGSIDKKLEHELRNFPNAVWSTYGMTETLSHIAMRRVNGPSASEYYKPMSGVNVHANEDGCLEIYAPSICPNMLQTNDIVEFSGDMEGFRIIGRRDNVVNTGGIKVQIEEVEDLLNKHFDFNFAITKQPDIKLGETIVMVIEYNDSLSDGDIFGITPSKECPIIRNVSDYIPSLREILARVCKEVLPKYYRPHYFYIIDKLPMTATSKIARKQLERLVAQL